MEKKEPEPSKYQQIRQWITGGIADGRFSAGQKLPSEHELASSFSVSRQTVRQAISALEAAGIVRRVRGSGTYVGSCALRPRTNNIGVITTYLDDYIFPSIIQGIEHVLTKQRFHMTLGITYNKTANEARALESMLELGVDGLIIEGTKSAFPSPNLDLYQKLRQRRIPIVFINGYYGDFPANYVVMDDERAGEIACESLLELGHTRIGGIFKSDDMQGHKRYAGFLQAMKKRRILLDDSSVFWFTTEDFPDIFDGSFDHILLKRLKKTTGLVCYNDQVAEKLLQLMDRNREKLPQPLSLVSFDDSSLAKKSIYNLSSVVYPGRQIGSSAAELLLRRIETGKEQINIKLEPSIKLRGSIHKP